MSSDYRFAAPVAVRILGAVVSVGGVVVLVAAALVGATGWSPVWLVAAALLALGGVAVAWLALRRGYVVRLGESGYRVRLVRGVGVAVARWVDVDDVIAADVAGSPCAVLRLKDGRTTTIPVAALEGPGQEFVDELRRRLDAGHGFTRLG
ncbi:MAG: hypothetical protein ACRDPI_03355 [Nocardioidaceae bacterium]